MGWFGRKSNEDKFGEEFAALRQMARERRETITTEIFTWAGIPLSIMVARAKLGFEEIARRTAITEAGVREVTGRLVSDVHEARETCRGAAKDDLAATYDLANKLDFASMVDALVKNALDESEALVKLELELLIVGRTAPASEPDELRQAAKESREGLAADVNAWAAATIVSIRSSLAPWFDQVAGTSRLASSEQCQDENALIREGMYRELRALMAAAHAGSRESLSGAYAYAQKVGVDPILDALVGAALNEMQFTIGIEHRLLAFASYAKLASRTKG